MPWFKRPSDGELFRILDHYTDTIKRLRVEGWAEVESPVATTEESVAAQVEVVTPASSPERAAPATKRPPVKAKTVRKRTPVSKPLRKPSMTGRKVGQL